MTIREAKKIATQKFAASPIHAVTATPALDASLLISHVTGFDRSQMILQRDKELTTEQEHQFFAAVSKRETGLPIAYITGYKEFFGLDFIVTPDVLIPKPDTEILVEKTIEIINNEQLTIDNYFSGKGESQNTANIAQSKNANFQFSIFNPQLKICDMCTGSGCVGISVINNFQFSFFNFQLVLADISEAALAVARKNAERLLSAEQLANTKFLQGDLFDAVDNYVGTGDAPITEKTLNDDAPRNQPQLFDIIVSNPPYIPSRMVDELLQDGRSEPRIALDGDGIIDNEQLTIDNYSSKQGEHQKEDRREQNKNDNCQLSITNYQLKTDGLSIIRRLVPESFAHLNDGGYFLCETGEYNAHETAELFKATGFTDVKIFYDLAGTPRVVCGRKHKM